MLAKTLEFTAEYLTTRDIFNLVFTSKLFMDALTITTVIKIFMMNGNQDTKTTFEVLHDLILKQSIYMPSPVQAIRHANTKVCELCRWNRVKHANVDGV